MILMLCLAAGAAHAQRPGKEQLQTDLSSHEVFIETNFNGVRVIVFGAVDNSRQATAESGFYDVVVSLRGPEESIIARQKERVAGLWLNTQAVTFSGAPSYYAVLSTRPLGEIAPAEDLKRLGLGFDSLVFKPENGGGDAETFREAVIKLKTQQKLYMESPGSVRFVGRSLFRGAFDLPANVPVGAYLADIYLFANGRLLSTDQTHITIDKAGIGEIVHSAAFGAPILYGVLAVLFAVIYGLTAGAVFRRV
jgi:uncharacterized protein (TIGR02186 family)